MCASYHKILASFLFTSEYGVQNIGTWAEGAVVSATRFIPHIRRWSERIGMRQFICKIAHLGRCLQEAKSAQRKCMNLFAEFQDYLLYNENSLMLLEVLFKSCCRTLYSGARSHVLVLGPILAKGSA